MNSIRMATVLLAAATGALPASATMAQDTVYSSEYTACIERSEGVTAVMLGCIHPETERQNAALKKAEQALSAALPRRNRAALTASQRDWRRFRQSTCNLHQQMDDGSAATLAAESCRLDLLVQRVVLLKQWQAQAADSR